MSQKKEEKKFNTLEELAKHLRQLDKKTILLFAYNGIGKTRLSMIFKELGKQNGKRDTLYFNAFTEDLFSWDNDLDKDSERMLQLNKDSRFFSGLKDLEMDNRIRPLLNQYADFDFRIDTDKLVVRFSREVNTGNISETIENIKISRGEENIFIWCFFLVIVELAMDKDIEAYSWVEYVYIDDPVSSLDENNAIAMGHRLAELVKKSQLKTVISSHHSLFFNVMFNEISNAKKYFLHQYSSSNTYVLEDTKDTPFFYHVAMLALLKKASETGELYTYHFNILRGILEKTANFLGYTRFSDCIKKNEDVDEGLYARLLNILSHDNYSLYDPVEMIPDNKDMFKHVLDQFVKDYNFNEKLLNNLEKQET